MIQALWLHSTTLTHTQLSAAAECSPLYYTAMDIGWNWKGGGMRKLRSLNTWALGQFPSMSLLRETLSYLASRYDFIFQKWACQSRTTNKYNQSIKELNEYATSSHLMSYRNHYVWGARGSRERRRAKERTFLFLMTFNQGCRTRKCRMVGMCPLIFLLLKCLETFKKCFQIIAVY